MTLLLLLQNPYLSPREVFAHSCQRILREAIRDVTQSKTPGDVGSYIRDGYIPHLLGLLCDITEGPNKSMQTYVVNQMINTHHEESYDLVEAVVSYLNEVEVKLKMTIQLDKSAAKSAAKEDQAECTAKRNLYISVIGKGRCHGRAHLTRPTDASNRQVSISWKIFATGRTTRIRSGSRPATASPS